MIELKGKKKTIEEKFFALLRSTSLARGGSNRFHIFLTRSYGRNGLLLGWSHQPYEEAIKAVRELHPQISEKAIGRLLIQSVVRLFEQKHVREDADPDVDAQNIESILSTLDSSDVHQEVINLLEELKTSIKTWTVILFVEGIELESLPELSLGTTTLYQKEHGPLPGILDELRQKERITEVVQRLEENTEHCRCYLALDIEGEERNATDQALQKGQDIVNILCMYLTSSQHREAFYQSIGVLGQPAITRSQSVIQCTPPLGMETDNRNYFISGRRPPARSHKINSEMVQKWKGQGIDKVIGIFDSENLKPGMAEMRVMRAITWYGRAVNAYTFEERYIGITTALESLLVAGERVSGISQRLADNVSAMIGGDFQSRKDLSERVKNLYTLRGNIVHAGEPVSRENLRVWDQIVSNTIIEFVRREM